MNMNTKTPMKALLFQAAVFLVGAAATWTLAWREPEPGSRPVPASLRQLCTVDDVHDVPGDVKGRCYAKVGRKLHSTCHPAAGCVTAACHQGGGRWWWRIGGGAGGGLERATLARDRRMDESRWVAARQAGGVARARHHRK